jgi:hypothetical protein
MSSKQTDLTGTPMGERIVKLTHTAGGYYLRVKNPKSEYYRAYETASGRLAFIPLEAQTEVE